MPAAIRPGPRPGDIGALIRLHGVLYAREYGWDHTYEAYVARTFAEAMPHFKDGRDALWVVEDVGSVLGSIGMLGRGAGDVQLRWFLLDPSLRGQGLGARLMDTALAFARGAGYRRVYLLTVSGLHRSAHLYARYGFVRTEQSPPQDDWGTRVTPERHELWLAPGPSGS
jgi:GNAT superfamily N-acetyltransferase